MSVDTIAERALRGIAAAHAMGPAPLRPGAALPPFALRSAWTDAVVTQDDITRLGRPAVFVVCPPLSAHGKNVQREVGTLLFATTTDGAGSELSAVADAAADRGVTVVAVVSRPPATPAEELVARRLGFHALVDPTLAFARALGVVCDVSPAATALCSQWGVDTTEYVVSPACTLDGPASTPSRSTTELPAPFSVEAEWGKPAAETGRVPSASASGRERGASCNTSDLQVSVGLETQRPTPWHSPPLAGPLAQQDSGPLGFPVVRGQSLLCTVPDATVDGGLLEGGVPEVQQGIPATDSCSAPVHAVCKATPPLHPPAQSGALRGAYAIQSASAPQLMSHPTPPPQTAAKRPGLRTSHTTSLDFPFAATPPASNTSCATRWCGSSQESTTATTSTSSPSLGCLAKNLLPANFIVPTAPGGHRSRAPGAPHPPPPAPPGFFRRCGTALDAVRTSALTRASNQSEHVHVPRAQPSVCHPSACAVDPPRIDPPRPCLPTAPEMPMAPSPPAALQSPRRHRPVVFDVATPSVQDCSVFESIPLATEPPAVPAEPHFTAPTDVVSAFDSHGHEQRHLHGESNAGAETEPHDHQRANGHPIAVGGEPQAQCQARLHCLPRDTRLSIASPPARPHFAAPVAGVVYHTPVEASTPDWSAAAVPNLPGAVLDRCTLLSGTPLASEMGSPRPGPPPCTCAPTPDWSHVLIPEVHPPPRASEMKRDTSTENDGSAIDAINERHASENQGPHCHQQLSLCDDGTGPTAEVAKASTSRDDFLASFTPLSSTTALGNGGGAGGFSHSTSPTVFVATTGAWQSSGSTSTAAHHADERPSHDTPHHHTGASLRLPSVFVFTPVTTTIGPTSSSIGAQESSEKNYFFLSAPTSSQGDALSTASEAPSRIRHHPQRGALLSGHRDPPLSANTGTTTLTSPSMPGTLATDTQPLLSDHVNVSGTSTGEAEGAAGVARGPGDRNGGAAQYHYHHPCTTTTSSASTKDAVILQPTTATAAAMVLSVGYVDDNFRRVLGRDDLLAIVRTIVLP